MNLVHASVPVLLLIALALAIVRLRSLLAIAILTGVYSLVLALIYTLLDAVDVAFTEAAVGAGITLTLMLVAMSLTTRREAVRPRNRHRKAIALVVAASIGLGFGYATFDMPSLGDPSAPVHRHVAPRYITAGPAETGVPNMVTAVLASYRGYDTMGEVAVIFTAGISVIALLWRWRRDKQ
jgi:multicomponent Na+:H+ antiporter subunit B